MIIYPELRHPIHARFMSILDPTLHQIRSVFTSLLFPIYKYHANPQSIYIGALFAIHRYLLLGLTRPAYLSVFAIEDLESAI